MFFFLTALLFMVAGNSIKLHLEPDESADDEALVAIPGIAGTKAQAISDKKSNHRSTSSTGLCLKAAAQACFIGASSAALTWCLLPKK